MTYFDFMYFVIFSQGPFCAAIMLLPIVLSCMFVCIKTMDVVGAPIKILYDYFIKYSKIGFSCSEKEYRLCYLIRHDFLQLKSGNTITGSIEVHFKEYPLQKDEIEAVYFPVLKEIQIKNAGLQLKNKVTKSMVAKWYLEKSSKEIKEIITNAIFAVIKKEYPNILIDPVTKDLKLKL